MATRIRKNDLGKYFWRAGERIEIVEAPDRFTVRMKRGVPSDKVGESYHTVHKARLQRQNLDEFGVDAAERDAVMARVRSGNEVEFASHVYTLAAEPQTRLYLTDQITVQFKPEVSDAEIEAIIAEYGLSIVKQIQGLPRAFVLGVGPQATENPVKLANRLAANDKVLVSEPNMAVATKRQYIPSDTLFPDQWHLHNSGGPQLAVSAHIDAVRAWDLTRGHRSVIVAVADDSCDTRHADFQGAGKLVAPRDFAGSDFDPQPELVDDNHGTACCGVAVAEENGNGVVGVAPGCALMPIRTTGFIDDTSIEDLCDWVIAHNAGVLSCSWSAAARRFALSLRMSNALHRAATVGRGGLGCVLVFAAGNENRPVNGTVHESGWPNNQPSGATAWLNGFAVHPDVMAIAASSSLATKSAYSNWGAEISVCAPSNNVRPSTYPRVNGPVSGRGIVTTDRVGTSGYSSTDYTRDFGGTSSACPTVAGVAGLVLSAYPGLSAQAVRTIIETTTDRIVDPSTDPQLGNSLGTYDASGHSPWFGRGRVNAFKAVTEALRRKREDEGGGAGGGTQALVKASTPALAIPDNDTTGVRDTLSFTEPVRLSEARLSIDLVHTYVGDLRLTLISPAGTQVVLHDRNGGNADNIQRSFDAGTTPGLSLLNGEPVQGAWTLWVQDLARADTGKLERWELALTAGAGVLVEAADAPGLLIPDNTPAGIERTLDVARSGALRDIEVSVDITHTYIGDLQVTLVSPAGTAVVLHSRGGGTQDNIVTTYAAANLPSLAGLRGQAMQGRWRLQVADLAGLDIGKLNRWALRIVG